MTFFFNSFECPAGSSLTRGRGNEQRFEEEEEKLEEEEEEEEG